MLGSLVRYALLGIMLVNALLAGGSYSVRELILIALTGGCILISAMRTNDKTLLFTLIVIIAARDIPMKRIAKVYFWTYLSIITVVFVLFFLKVLPDYTMERGEDLVRHSLGFNHPNLLGRLVFTEIISFALGYPERARNRLFSVCGILAAVFGWFVPNSRTAFLCIVLYVVLMLFSQSAFMRSSFARAGCYIVPVLLCVVSIVCVPFYDEGNRLFSLINRFFTGRLALAARTYEAAGWGGIWGHDAYWTNIPLDNCYDKLALYFGFAALAIFMAALFASLHRALKHARYDIALALVVFSVFGVFEIHTFYILYNLCLLALSAKLEERSPDPVTG